MSNDTIMISAGAARPEDSAGMLAALIQRSRLYKSGPDYVALMNFISRMRHMAPFNATLLHMQKPGLMFAATDVDWFNRFGRTVKEGARPLVILWPFSPVALVYDVDDTEGPDLPADVAEPFRAQGDICVFRGCRSTSPRDVGPGFRRKPVQWRAGRMYFG